MIHALKFVSVRAREKAGADVSAAGNFRNLGKLDIESSSGIVSPQRRDSKSGIHGNEIETRVIRRSYFRSRSVRGECNLNRDTYNFDEPGNGDGTSSSPSGAPFPRGKIADE